MKRILCILLFIQFILSSCTSNYFLCETDVPVKLYASPSISSTHIDIPVEKNLISIGGYKKYRKVKYGNHEGYVYKTKFKLEKKIIHLTDWVYDFETLEYKYSPSYNTNSNSLKYSSKSTSTNSGTVHVKGHYRKNGTYVKPYTRKAPSRRR